MEQGLMQFVCGRSMRLSITLLVLLAANAQAAEGVRKRTFSQLGCAWSECRSCSQYRSLCQAADPDEGADIVFAKIGPAREAPRASRLPAPFPIPAVVGERARPDDLRGQASKDSPFGDLESCGNFPGALGGRNFTGSKVGPWIDVNRADSDNIVAVWQQDRWSDGGARGNVAAVTVDGGTNWRIVPIPGLTDCTGGPWQRASDPWVSFSPDGTVHQMSLVFQTPDPDGAGGFGPNAMVVSKSTDGGLTWSTPVTLIEDDGGRIMNSRNSLAADPTDTKLVYAAWNRLRLAAAEAAQPEGADPAQGDESGAATGFEGPVFFSRSTDGGDTWEPARKIYDPGPNRRAVGNRIAVLPDGRVIGLISELSGQENGDANGSPSVFDLSLIWSADKGKTWRPAGSPIRVSTIQSDGAVTPDERAPVRDASALFDVAVDPESGRLYAAWQDRRFTGTEGIAFSMSSDGGFTWSSPIRINQTPAVPGRPLREQAFLPSIAVADNGIVAVTYYDFRNDTDAPGGELADYFAVHCERECSSPANWGNEIRLTDTSFDIRRAPFTRGFFLGDYEGLASDGVNFLPAFGVTSPTDPASVVFRRFFLYR